MHGTVQELHSGLQYSIYFPLQDTLLGRRQLDELRGDLPLAPNRRQDAHSGIEDNLTTGGDLPRIKFEENVIQTHSGIEDKLGSFNFVYLGGWGGALILCLPAFERVESFNLCIGGEEL